MCRKWVCSVMLVVFGVAGAPPATHAQVENLLLNPSFEEDEPILDDAAWEQWTTWGWDVGLNSTVEFDEGEFIDGTRSLKVLPTGGTNWWFMVLQDNIPLTVGQPYTASFWAKAEEDRPLFAKFKATDNSADWGQTDFELTTEWAEYYITAEAVNASAKFEIHCAAVDTPLWLDFVYVYEGEYVAGMEPSGLVSPGTARVPNPADASVVDTTAVMLQWRAGRFATSHKVYFGESLDAVAQGTVEPVTTGATMLKVGVDPPYANGLTPGQVYYWRVDEVNDVHADSPWPGNVWSFRVRPLTAWAPTPGDGLEYVRVDQNFTWEHGMGVIFHTVYFGESFEQVDGGLVAGWPTVDPVYTPLISLEVGKTYYWRVDEMTMAGIPQRGNVWSFTTVPDVAVTDPDLLGWWTLDEGMGTTAVDWSGHGNHAALVGSPQWTHGVRDGALALADGTHVEIPALNVPTNTVTMTAWVKADGRQTDWAAILFSREGSAVSGVGFGPSNELRYHWTDLYWDFATGIIAPTHEWFFVALVVEPTQATLYYDGTETLVTNTATHGLDPFDGVLRIGQDWAGRDLQGTVDDVRFYNKALSKTEIAAVMRGDPLLAWDPTPAPDAVLDTRNVGSLRWSAGDTAASHDVYVGTDRAVVAAADKGSAEYQGNQTATSFSADNVVEIGGGEYSWRIDEVEAGGAVHTGRVWTFTVLPYLLVDDFESYTDEVGERVFQTWIDGYGYTDPVVVEGNGTGSTVGHTEPPFAETRIVYSGGQSMPMEYDNTAAPGYSETDRTFATAQDWTVEGVTTLVIHVRGAAGNTGQLYAKINGVRAPAGGNPPDIASTSWIAWEIDLASVGVNLASVTTLTVGVEGGDTGDVYIDDIWLTKP